MNYAESLKENRRLAVLKLLIEDGGHSNESVLEMALRSLGHHAGLDRPYVRELIRFLDEAGCVTLHFFKDKVMVVQITERGVSIARGSIQCAGIAQPGLGA